MKNHVPGAGNRMRLATPLQRLFALAVLAFFAWLIWLAITGRYDHEVNRVATWLHEHWRRWVH